jgi:hypothetical protein
MCKIYFFVLLRSQDRILLEPVTFVSSALDRIIKSFNISSCPFVIIIGYVLHSILYSSNELFLSLVTCAGLPMF